MKKIDAKNSIINEANEFKKFISECAYHVKNYKKNKIFVAEFQIMWYTN